MGGERNTNQGKGRNEAHKILSDAFPITIGTNQIKCRTLAHSRELSISRTKTITRQERGTLYHELTPQNPNKYLIIHSLQVRITNFELSDISLVSRYSPCVSPKTERKSPYAPYNIHCAKYTKLSLTMSIHSNSHNRFQ